MHTWGSICIFPVHKHTQLIFYVIPCDWLGKTPLIYNVGMFKYGSTIECAYILNNSHLDQAIFYLLEPGSKEFSVPSLARNLLR
jgi:hypothetical protein